MVTAFKKLPGVIDATADFDSKTATIKFDPAKVKADALPDALKGTRFSVKKS